MKKSVLLVLTTYFLLSACGPDQTGSGIIFSSPEAGMIVKSGDSVLIDLDIAADRKIDSIVYTLDSSVVARRKDTASIRLSTAPLTLGSHLISSKIYSGKNIEEASSNIVILGSKAPLHYRFEVVKSFPHDTSSYTQGLEYHDGILYESDGGYADLGGSSLRKVQLETGEVLKKLDISEKIFAEGITIVGNRIIQLTWQDGIGIIYDKDSFKKLGEFPYQASREGWGLCFDGEKLLKSDGTNRIYFLDKDSYNEKGFIEVYDDTGEVGQLNELEYIDGKIYANVYSTDKIVIIDPKTGLVEAEINLIGLLPQKDHLDNTEVLNGIAWDAARKRLFVTGKKWNTLFEIRLIKE